MELNTVKICTILLHKIARFCSRTPALLAHLVTTQERAKDFLGDRSSNFQVRHKVERNCQQSLDSASISHEGIHKTWVAYEANTKLHGRSTVTLRATQSTLCLGYNGALSHHHKSTACVGSLSQTGELRQPSWRA